MYIVFEEEILAEKVLAKLKSIRGKKRRKNKLRQSIIDKLNFEDFCF